MIRIGIFFGGSSREREISFAGGRTVYDNLDKSLFEPIPIFVDNWGKFTLLDWQYLYKGSVRDFFPPAAFLPKDNFDIQLYADSLYISPEEHAEMCNSIGQLIALEQLPELIDFAFLALHGAKGEDGSIQGLLEFLNIPYSGSGMLPSAIGMDKSFQKNTLKGKSYSGTQFTTIHREDWSNGNQMHIYEQIKKEVPIPFVSRPANQGSSIGVGMMMEDDFQLFQKQVNQAFFVETLPKQQWLDMDKNGKIEWLKNLSDIRSSIGFPLMTVVAKVIDQFDKETNAFEVQLETEQAIFLEPKNLLSFIDNTFKTDVEGIKLEGLHSESAVLIESFIEGREFSCIVVRTETGEIKALPPTEIIKGNEIYDYRSKYLPGMSRKQTPIDLPNEEIEKIRESCIDLFQFFRFDVYARIDGFYKSDGSIILNDPNTTSGMLPSSFFFHQAAEIGLNPSQFLTFLVRQSLAERLKANPLHPNITIMLQELDAYMEQLKDSDTPQTKVAVIMGGYSTERHVSVESGRNIYEKLASTSNYQPIPYFLTGEQGNWSLYQIPVNLMLKDNADDIREKVEKNAPDNPLLLKIREECLPITQKYASGKIIYNAQKTSVEELANTVDFVFIGLHGRPGEDGELQEKLEAVNLPYNGSPIRSSRITIDKYKTNQLLHRKGFPIAEQKLIRKEKWQRDPSQMYQDIAMQFPYPFIVKPVDDGCSSAVKVIRNEEQLSVYSKMIFRDAGDISDEAIAVLKLKPKEEMPIKKQFLVETFTQKKESKHFLEVTGGLLTRINEAGELEYEMFEASETLTADEILSLEEKFLAGEGQNITPARYAKDAKLRQEISDKVKETLLKAAKILDIQGYARIDAFVRIWDAETEVIIIEVNSLPGMTPATAIFHQAALNGYKPYEFIDKIIQFGMEKKALS